jgi:ubiquitin C-terminal hydrolase
LSAKLSNPAEAVKIYELYAVLVHAGSRIGGHYYAFGLGEGGFMFCLV